MLMDHKTLTLPVYLPIWSESDLKLVMVTEDAVTEGDTLHMEKKQKKLVRISFCLQ